ncbi:MAG: hypothetical protein ACRC37_01625 [Lentisphaeria bacterium]
MIVDGERNKNLITSAKDSAIGLGYNCAYLSKSMPREVEAVVALALKELSELTSNSFKENPSAIVTVAHLLIESYGHWSINDFILLFKNIAKNKYGKTFGLMSIERIMECADMFDLERTEIINKKIYNKSIEDRNLWKKLNLNPIAENVENVLKKIENQKKENRKKDLQQEWVGEFNRIAEIQGVDKLPMIINYEGHKMGIDEFLKYKLSYMNKHTL